MSSASTRPRNVNAGDIVVYPVSMDGDRVQAFREKCQGDFQGYRKVERGADWIRLEPLHPDLDFFGDWLDKVGKFGDFMQFVWKPVNKGSMEGYWRVYIWFKTIHKV